MLEVAPGVGEVGRRAGDQRGHEAGRHDRQQDRPRPARAEGEPPGRRAVTRGERDAHLRQGHAGAHRHERHQQQVALVARRGVREAVLDRRPVVRGQDHRATAGCGDERGGELLDALGAEGQEHEHPGASGHRTPAREREVAAQRHDRDGGRCRGSDKKRSRGCGGGEEQRQTERHQGGQRVPVVERPAQPSLGAGEERRGLLRAGEQVGAQSRRDGHAGHDHHRRRDARARCGARPEPDRDGSRSRAGADRGSRRLARAHPACAPSCQTRWPTARSRRRTPRTGLWRSRPCVSSQRPATGPKPLRRGRSTRRRSPPGCARSGRSRLRPSRGTARQRRPAPRF